jgi:hypothetical protein
MAPDVVPQAATWATGDSELATTYSMDGDSGGTKLLASDDGLLPTTGSIFGYASDVIRGDATFLGFGIPMTAILATIAAIGLYSLFATRWRGSETHLAGTMATYLAETDDRANRRMRGRVAQAPC